MANPTMTLIASITVGSGGVSSVTFSSIPQTYTDLKLVYSTKVPGAASYEDITILVNNSTGSKMVGLYTIDGSSTHSFTVTVGAAAYNYAGDSNGTISTTANTFSNGETYFPNYTSTNTKSYSADAVVENNATAATLAPEGGYFTTSTGITSITLAPSASFVQYSTFYLYGISNS